jgi:hypothetical protein
VSIGTHGAGLSRTLTDVPAQVRWSVSAGCITETVLNNRLGRPEDMPAQIHRLSELAKQENVTLRIIPSGAELPIPPYHGFELLDDRCVIVDVFNTLLTTQGQADTALYRLVFDRLEASATDEIQPILDRYLDVYLDLSRPRRRRD